MEQKKLKSFGIILGLILILTVSGKSILYSQTLDGTWQENTYNISLILATDGQYQLQYPNGRSQGRYQFNGQMLCLQDMSGTPPVCYSLVKLSIDTLILRDATGVMMNYHRQRGSQQDSTPSGQQDTRDYVTKNPGAAAILAQKGNYTLTNNHFLAGLGILQFVIGQTVKPIELQELKTKLVEEFQLAPTEVLRQLESLGNSLAAIHKASDPVRIGLARQEIFSALYLATLPLKEMEKPLMVQIMNRYIKVLAYDAVNKLVLTDKDALGMINYLAFNSQLLGQEMQVTPSVQQSVISDLVNRFPTMSVEQKRLLCSASLIWQLIETNWNRMTMQQRQQYKNAFVSHMGKQASSYPSSPTGTGYPASSTTTKSSNSSKSALEQMREYNARQSMLRMMNRMNMNSHALSLNIIENIGGTGNYWKVIDY